MCGVVCGQCIRNAISVPCLPWAQPHNGFSDLHGPLLLIEEGLTTGPPLVCLFIGEHMTWSSQHDVWV